MRERLWTGGAVAEGSGKGKSEGVSQGGLEDVRERAMYRTKYCRRVNIHRYVERPSGIKRSSVTCSKSQGCCCLEEHPEQLRSGVLSQDESCMRDEVWYQIVRMLACPLSNAYCIGPAPVYTLRDGGLGLQ